MVRLVVENRTRADCRRAKVRRPAAAVVPGGTRGSLLGMALRAGRLGRLRRGFARAGVARTGVAGHDLRCRPRRGVRPRGNDLLDPAAAGAAGEQRCDDDYRDDRHPMPPRAVTIQAFQWGQIRTAARLAALPAECAATLPGNPFAHAVSEREPDSQGEGKLHHHNTIALDISV
jgi:hypothetical protein